MRLPPDLRIPPSRTEELHRLLLERPQETLFHIAVLEERGITSSPGESSFGFLGWPEEGPLRAAAFVGGLWFASVTARSPADAAEMGRHLREKRLLRLRRVVGERGATDAFWTAWSPGQVETVLSHPQQLMLAEPAGVGTLALPELRPAFPSEEEWVYEASAAMQIEELDVDPRIEEASTFRAQVAERLRSGRTWVATDRGEIVFKAEVALKNRIGAQIGGVWVPPAHRGKRLASRGMSELARRMLREVPVVSLHVHEKNEPAVRAYRTAGFRDAVPFRLVRGLPAGSGRGEASAASGRSGSR